jgi:hypothetical protein
MNNLSMAASAIYNLRNEFWERSSANAQKSGDQFWYGKQMFQKELSVLAKYGYTLTSYNADLDNRITYRAAYKLDIHVDEPDKWLEGVL